MHVYRAKWTIKKKNPSREHMVVFDAHLCHRWMDGLSFLLRDAHWMHLAAALRVSVMRN